MLNIEFKKVLDEELGSLINVEFNKYANKSNVESNYSSFCFVAKENNEVMGLVTGYSYYNEVHIGDLIVLEQHRNKDIGSQLINTVENHYKNKGFKHMNLSTYDFQAPEFYKKCGFQIEYIREDIENTKLTKYFFIKYFNR